MKKGIAFFPMSCVQSITEEVLEAEYGHIATTILVVLQRKIYGEEGFYCIWCDPIHKLVAHKAGIDPDVLTDFLETAMELGVFSREMYEMHGILTSETIQEQFFYAVARRKQFDFNREYLLLRDDQLPKALQLHDHTEPANDDVVQTDCDLNSENDAVSTDESQACYHDTDKTRQTKQDDTIQNETTRNDTTQNKTTQEKQEKLPLSPLAPPEDEIGYFGSYANVKLSFGEYKTLVLRFGEHNLDRYIEKLSRYMETKDRHYPDCANTLFDWMEQDGVQPPTYRK